MASKRRAKKVQQYRHEEQPRRAYRGRRWFLLGLFALGGIALVVRAVEQQVFETDFLQHEGQRRHLSTMLVPAWRGMIRDRHGEVLAVSTPVESVWANPRVLRPDDATLAPLARILDLRVGSLRRQLARHSQRHFVYLKRRVPPHVAEQVRALLKKQDINSFGLQREYRRYYPGGEVFAHLVGFTNIDDEGQEGLELAYDQVLRAQPGAKRVVRDGRRRVVDDVESIRAPRPGQDLTLSIDRRLQYLTYRALKAAREKHNARAASAVILDVQTGEVLALANQPGYNPNASRSNRGGRLRNRALTDAYEPGSTMKPFIVAAALAAGTVKADQRIDTSGGVFKVGRDRVTDHHPLGVIDLPTLLHKSSNVGAAKVALSMPAKTLWQQLNAFGFGETSGVGFPGEAAGQLTSYPQWSRFEQATLSFGYGLTATTVQLARAYAMLGADGLLRPLSLLRLDRAEDGERVLPRRVARQVRQMLEGVVSAQGTAIKAAVPGYRIAGKTGTSRKLKNGKYSDKAYRAVFAGLAPASAPRLAMVVMIDEPRGKKFYGGDVAAPVFAEVMSHALRMLNIAPDKAVAGARLAQVAQ